MAVRVSTLTLVRLTPPLIWVGYRPCPPFDSPCQSYAADQAAEALLYGSATFFPTCRKI